MPALPMPTPPLGDGVVALRAWREADVAAQLGAFGDPLFERLSDWAPSTEAAALEQLPGHEAARLRGEQLHLAVVDANDLDALLGGASRCGFTREGLLRSHMPFKDGRRDTVVFGLLPGELRERG
ncbi:MAG: GNAT family N-acetyltransferase [Thermoleophilia bacterium]|nr:GNAT family N-acetyltransferase [Thermoleophilia bacterium]